MKTKDAAQTFVREKHHSKRISARVAMKLNGMNIGVKCFLMYVEQKKPSEVKLSRKTNEELPINPLFYNFDVVDTIRPYLKNFFLYGIKNGLLRKKQTKSK